MKKIIFIHYNYEPEHFPVKPDPDNRFFTYGFGSNFARNFKYYYPEYSVEMWRLDSGTDKYYKNEVQGVLFRIFPAFSLFNTADISFKFIRELKKEVKKSSPVLFVSHTHIWLLYQIAFFFRNSPIASSHHGDFSPIFRQTYRKGFRKLKDKIDTAVEKKVMKYVDHFFVCDYNAIPNIKTVAPNSSISISSTGLNIDAFEKIDKQTARKKLGLSLDKRYILYIGKLYSYKQPRELIDIWKDIKSERKDVELIIAGNSEEDEYYDYAAGSGAILAGRVLNRDLNYYYSASDVYVLLSLRDDYFGGTGIAPLESLACGTPIVSNSMRNYLGNNMEELGEVPGTLSEYKTAILKVLDNPGIYRNMRESVKKYYSHKSITERKKNIFEDLFKKYMIN